uniref:Kazal-like domain-containing protein n=1 Tax=Timema monikensis TaxID=170555 RepID=A0A7R9EFX6_9NEOP|nr:unnamed protein product [Timema monikensis]
MGCGGAGGAENYSIVPITKPYLNSPSWYTGVRNTALDHATTGADDKVVTNIVSADPCLIKYCGKGRECRLRDGEARCECQTRCRKHHKLVCGTDGHLYPNHCELHRAACLQGTAIAVDHHFGCVDTRQGHAETEDYPQSTNTPHPNGTSTTPSYEETSFNKTEVEDPYLNETEKQAECSIPEYEIMKYTFDQDSNLGLPVIGRLVYCESSALDHAATNQANMSGARKVEL